MTILLLIFLAVVILAALIGLAAGDSGEVMLALVILAIVAATVACLATREHARQCARAEQAHLVGR